MLLDVILNIAAPVAAKRSAFLRKALWLVFAVGIGLAWGMHVISSQ